MTVTILELSLNVPSTSSSQNTVYNKLEMFFAMVSNKAAISVKT